MSTWAADAANAFLSGRPRPTRYLELGIQGGGTFSRVIADEKHGVDLHDYGFSPTHLMATDEFFSMATDPSILYDAIFVDACHHFPQVWRDFQNSARRLKPGGLLLLHDLVPPTIEDTSPSRCHDAYRLLVLLLAQTTCIPPSIFSSSNRQIRVLPQDLGLTAIVQPRVPEISDDLLAWFSTAPWDALLLPGSLPRNLFAEADDFLAWLERVGKNRFDAWTYLPATQ